MSQSRNISKCVRVSKEFSTIGPQFEAPLLSLKHIMILHRANLKKEKTGFYYEYTQSTTYKPYEKSINLIFRNQFEYIQIESKTNKIEYQDKDYSIFINSKVFYKDFIDVKRSLKEVENWYETKDLYRIDDKNRIIDIKSEYEKLNSVAFFKGKFETRYIGFKPCVVYDNEICYPGVQISNEQGILAQITYDEFLLFKMSLLEYMHNFQTNSMLLLNMTYNHLASKPEDSTIKDIENL